jgi:peptide/nickel transport system substrate-binding protein
MDPAINRGDTGTFGDATQASLIFDQLLREDWITTDVTPRLASSVTSADAVTWTMKLRPNVKFTDGTSFDAAAVKFNYQRIGDPATGAVSIGAVQGMQSIDVVDPLTLRIVLKSPNVQFPRMIARQLDYVGSPTAFQAEGSGFGSAPVGAGAFIMKSWVRNGQMVLNRNPNYWDAPRPYLDQIIIKQIPDNSQRFNTYLTGAGDMATVSQDPSYIAQASKAGASLQNYTPAVGGLHLTFNTTQAPFNDARVRQAVAQAMDLNQINATAYSGLNGIPTGFIRAPSPYADPSITQLAYNQTQAQTLFNQVAADTGQPISISLLCSTTIPLVGQAIQGLLTPYKNVKVSLEMVAPAQIVQREVAKSYQFTITSINAYDPDDFAATVITGGSNNFTGYSNSVVDAAVAKERSSFTQSDRMAAFQALQRQVYQDVPIFEFTIPPRVLYYNPKVQDVESSNGGINWESVWIQH